MAHRICCPRSHSVDPPDPPCRPHVQLDGALDGALAVGVLPVDHPHGARFHMSPVDVGILKSPKIADKIKLKMSKKRSRALRRELSRITDGPYEDDAHALTSTSIVNATETYSWGGDGTMDVESHPRRACFPSRTPDHRGTGDEEMACVRASRPALYSPSVYSRSQSRLDGEAAPITCAQSTLPHDFWGFYYRFQLPRKPSTSANTRNPHWRHASRHRSASTESTITRRLEQSRVEDPYPSLLDPASYRNENGLFNSAAAPKMYEKATVLEHKRQGSEHREHA